VEENGAEGRAAKAVLKPEGQSLACQETEQITANTTDSPVNERVDIGEFQVDELQETEGLVKCRAS
jgi:hypothetical protein